VDTTERTPHLTRSTTDRVLAGVAGGIAAHWGVDPTWVRVAFVFTTILWGAGWIVYALLWITLPESARDENDEEVVNPPVASESPRMVAGILLVVLGSVLLLWKVLSWLSFHLILPVALIALGLFLLRRQERGR
jgi:phage shock protein PspC (stress-responsive transcriptional regulator)